MTKPTDKRVKSEIAQSTVSPSIPISYSLVAKDAPIWLGNALASGLENAGYEVTPVKDMNSAKTTYVVTLQLTELSCGPDRTFSFQANYRSVVEATVALYTNNQKIFDQSYKGEYVGPFRSISFERTSTIANFLNFALEKFLEQAVPGLASVMLHGAQAPQPITDNAH